MWLLLQICFARLCIALERTIIKELNRAFHDFIEAAIIRATGDYLGAYRSEAQDMPFFLVEAQLALAELAEGLAMVRHPNERESTHFYLALITNTLLPCIDKNHVESFRSSQTCEKVGASPEKVPIHRNYTASIVEHVVFLAEQDENLLASLARSCFRI